MMKTRYCQSKRLPYTAAWLSFLTPNAHGILRSLAKSFVNRHIAGALLSSPNTRLAYE
jgi:FixJ family two-component response regulator